MSNNTITSLPKTQVPAREGMAELFGYIQKTWFCEHADILRHYIIAAAKGERNGRPYNLSADNLAKVNKTLQELGQKTFFVTITREPNNDTLSASCGQTPAEQLQTLSGLLRLRPLLNDKAGINNSWIDHHMNATTHNMYNKFTDHELRLINETIRAFGLKLLTTELV